MDKIEKEVESILERFVDDVSFGGTVAQDDIEFFAIEISKLIERECLKARKQQCHEIIDAGTHTETSHDVIEEIISEIIEKIGQL